MNKSCKFPKTPSSWLHCIIACVIKVIKLLNNILYVHVKQNRCTLWDVEGLKLVAWICLTRLEKKSRTNTRNARSCLFSLLCKWLEPIFVRSVWDMTRSTAHAQQTIRLFTFLYTPSVIALQDVQKYVNDDHNWYFSLTDKYNKTEYSCHSVFECFLLAVTR